MDTAASRKRAAELAVDLDVLLRDIEAARFLDYNDQRLSKLVDLLCEMSWCGGCDKKHLRRVLDVVYERGRQDGVLSVAHCL
jgi:hypothetical protein